MLIKCALGYYTNNYENVDFPEKDTLPHNFRPIILNGTYSRSFSFGLIGLDPRLV